MNESQAARQPALPPKKQVQQGCGNGPINVSMSQKAHTSPDTVL